MTLSNRLLLFIPGIMLTAFPILIFAGENFKEDWPAGLFFFIFAGLSLYFSIETRLITSSFGIKYYFFPPLHFTVAWSELKSITGNQRGTVHLSFSSTAETSRFQKLSGSTIHLSSFVDNWENSELVSEIKKYAPQLTVPEQVIIGPKLKIWQRPGIILVYYIVCFLVPLIFLAILGSIFPWSLIGFPLILANYGFMGGIFGGMGSLLDYSGWLVRFRAKKKFIKKFDRIVILNYLLPFSGWAIVFIFSFVAQFFGLNYTADPTGGIFHGISFLIGLMQALFLPYKDRPKEDYS